ncbi:MAG TPA: J domain-containing protein [Candidatus Limnocylindria bacterium]|nr:J domain-containing protein [Candidatus Limnocylindria bacterium]
MLSAFEQLGVRADASEQDIRAAYHRLVKSCHPDRFLDPEEQQAGQRKLIGINLAYEQAMKIAGSRRTVSSVLPVEQAKSWARKLLERRQFELALTQLSKSEGRDAEWFALQGQALGGMREFISSHQAWRAAVRMEPDNLDYRRGALEAELRLRHAGDFAHKAMDQVRNIFRRKNA